MGLEGVEMEEVGRVEEQGIFDYLTKRDYMIGLQNAGHGQILANSWVLGWTTRTFFCQTLAPLDSKNGECHDLAHYSGGLPVGKWKKTIRIPRRMSTL